MFVHAQDNKPIIIVEENYYDLIRSIWAAWLFVRDLVHFSTF